MRLRTLKELIAEMDAVKKKLILISGSPCVGKTAVGTKWKDELEKVFLEAVCEYLDGEYKETDIRIRHNEAVTTMGKENEKISFRSNKSFRHVIHIDSTTSSTSTSMYEVRSHFCPIQKCTRTPLIRQCTDFSM